MKKKTIKRWDNEDLDKRVLQAVGLSNRPGLKFSSLVTRFECRRKTNDDREIDRSLQRLRKRNVISFVNGYWVMP